MFKSNNFFILTSVVLVLALFLAGVPIDTEASSSGGWVHVKTEYNDSNNAANWSATQPQRLGTEYVYATLAKGQLNFTSVLEPNPATTSERTIQNMRATYSWNAPPSVIAANSTVSMRVTRSVTSNTQGVYTGGPANTVAHSAVGATLKNSSFVAPDRQSYTYSVFGTTSGIGSDAYLSLDSLVSDYSFSFAGPGQVGSQQQIRFVFNAGSFLYYENYIYEWREGSGTVSPPPQTTSKSFSDLAPSHWAHDTVMDMVNLGVLSGYPDGTFRPNNTISRAEFAKIMVLALNLPTSRPSTATFTDVPSSHWAYDVVESSKDYLTGYRNLQTGALSFEPSSVAVREDVAVAIVKANGFGNTTGNTNILSSFPDANQISPALINHVAIAVEKGYMQGSNIGFEPQKALTRAEACALLSRLIDRSQSGNEKISM